MAKCMHFFGFFSCHISEVFFVLKKKPLDFPIDVAPKRDGILNFVLLSYLVAKLYYALITSLAISQLREKKKEKKGKKSLWCACCSPCIGSFFFGAMKCAQLWGNCKVMNSNFIKFVGGHQFSYSNHTFTDSENWVS